MVPGEIFNVILTFAVRKVGGFAQNLYTVSQGTVVVSVDIVDPHHEGGPQSDPGACFDQDNCAPIADIELSAVVSHSDAEGKSERIAQPIDCASDVWVR
jgi:hypothetical protein